MDREDLRHAVFTVRHATDSEDAQDAANRIYKAFDKLSLRPPIPCVMCDNGDGHLRHTCPRA